MVTKKRRHRRKRRGLWSKRSDYTTVDGEIVSMDSTWEVECAKRLDELGIRWIRNPSMKLKYTTRGRRARNYIPDFYLPDHDVYIEVKGYWTEAARHKMKDVQARHPVRILILESLDEIAAVEDRIKCLLHIKDQG
jgi:predicted nuclease of restriction endonuclease-like RecB superfamily